MSRKILLLLVTLLFNCSLWFPSISIAQTCSPPSFTPPNNTCSNSSSVTITATVSDSSATFSGFAPGNSTITFKDNGVVVGTTAADAGGNFSQTITSIPGLHDFSLFVTDNQGRSTPETIFENVALTAHTDTPITNVHLAPTIDQSKVSLSNGDGILIFGQGSPGSTVHVVLNSNEIYSQTITSNSEWQVLISSGYSSGNNTVYAFLTRSGLDDSVNSKILGFQVGSCRRSDLNCDGHVNLTDFSILLYYWDTNAALADTNHDGNVGLIDFSIMLFDWTD